MKKIIALLAVITALSALPEIAHANVSIGLNAPGISLRIGDRDPRGNYWDGGRWRPQSWWSHHRHERGRWVYYEPPRHYHHDRRWREGPPPRHWHGGPPPGRWHEGPPPGRW